MQILVCNKNSQLQTKYINRKLVIVILALDMFKFDVIVVIMSIYDVKLLHFDQNSVVGMVKKTHMKLRAGIRQR